jgi:hypothetical protein
MKRHYTREDAKEIIIFVGVWILVILTLAGVFRWVGWI